MKEIEYDKIWDILTKINDKISCYIGKLLDFSDIFNTIDKGPKIFVILTYPFRILYYLIEFLLILTYISLIPNCIISAYMIRCPIIAIINTVRNKNITKKKKILLLILWIIILIVAIMFIIGKIIEFLESDIDDYPPIEDTVWV